jgi:hypothetical protein
MSSAHTRHEFRYLLLSPGGVEQCNEIRVAFSSLLDMIERNVPAGPIRERVTAKLQEACCHTLRGIAEKKGNVL